mgnify:CR=1 FL=1
MNDQFIQGVLFDWNKVDSVQFTVSSGRHSVLERPFSEANGHPFFVK